MSTVLTIKEREKLVKEMTPQLRDKLQKMQKLLNDAERVNLLNRYKFGCECADVVADKEKFGNAGLDQVAGYFNISIRNLHYFIAVKETFTQEEVESLMEERDAKGYLFTWTHLRSLTQVDKASDRKKLIKLWKSEGLENVEFAKRVQQLLAASAPEAGGDEPIQHRTNENSVRALLKQIKGAEERMQQLESSDLSAFATEAKKREMLESLMSQLLALEEHAEKLRDRIEQLRANQIDEVFNPDESSDDGDDSIDDLLVDVDNESDASETAHSVLSSQLRAPTKNTGSRLKHGKPGSAAQKKAGASGKKTGPAARRRRGAGVA